MEHSPLWVANRSWASQEKSNMNLCYKQILITDDRKDPTYSASIREAQELKTINKIKYQLP
jgi:hypothetical protein